MSDEQMAQVTSRLDQAEHASHRVGRKDWIILFLGGIFSLILTDLITPHTAQHIFVLLIEGVSRLYEIEGR